MLMAQYQATGLIRILRPATALSLLLVFSAPTASGYSVLTHEAIIDSTWDSAIRPLLLKRFPLATAEELTRGMRTPTEDASSRTLGTIHSATNSSAI